MAMPYRVRAPPHRGAKVSISRGIRAFRRALFAISAATSLARENLFCAAAILSRPFRIFVPNNYPYDMKTIQKSLIHAFALSLIAICAVVVSSCSDDPSSHAVLPRFSGIVLSSDNLAAGTMITATAHQVKTGKYLDRTTYSWKCSSDEAELRPSSGVFYESDKSDPYCYITLPTTPGTYIITFTATYNVSANMPNGTTEEEVEGGMATYTTSPLTGMVTITRKINVK